MAINRVFSAPWHELGNSGILTAFSRALAALNGGPKEMAFLQGASPQEAAETPFIPSFAALANASANTAEVSPAADNPETPEFRAALRDETSRILRLDNRKAQDLDPDATRLILNRAKYNLTGDPIHLTEYLPYRSAILDQPERLQSYDRLVRRLLAEIPMRRTEGVIESPDSRVDNLPVDPSTRYMVGAIFADLLHNRPDLVEGLLNRPRTLFGMGLPGTAQAPEVVVSSNTRESHPQAVGTQLTFAGIYQHVQLEGKAFWEGLKRPGSQFPILTHEVVHLLDTLQPGFLFTKDGLLPGLSSAQQRQFTAIREELFSRFSDEARQNPRGFISNGLRAYAFTNPLEYLATTVDTFWGDPGTLNAAVPELYKLYRDYFRVDPLNGYRPLATEGAAIAH